MVVIDNDLIQRNSILLLLSTLLLLGCGSLSGDEWIYAETPPPPESAQRPVVAIVGDSIAAGWQVCSPDPCKGVETHWWHAALGDQAIIRNRGIGNSTSEQLLSRWAQDTQDADIVVIVIGINDVVRVEDSVTTVTQNLQTMYQRANEANIIPVFTTLLPFEGHPEDLTETQAVNDYLRQQEDWLMIDLHTAFEDPDNPNQPRKTELATTIHPNSAGYERLGAYVRAWWLEHQDQLRR